MASVDMSMVARFAGCDTDDPILTACAEAAERSLVSAGVPEQPGDPAWEFTIAYYTAYLYDRRGDDSAPGMPPMVQSMLHQLRCVEG